MALTANKERITQRPDLAFETYFNVAASLEIFQGALLSVDASGNIVKAVSTARCAGVAYEYYNNTVASPTTTKPLRVEYNHIEQFTLAGVTDAAIDTLVYATADDTLTLTPNTCIVGYIRKISGTTIWVEVSLNK